jgi:ABC-2 type transport system permease protein
MFAIFNRELKAYFLTPIGYMYMGFFLLVTGIFFTWGNLFAQSPQFASFFGSILSIYLFAIPLLTMRLFSEERRQKTDQLLLTSPVSIPAIVLGKFFAALTLYALTLVITVMYAAVIAAFGELAVWETIGSYIGFIFLGASYISLGLFISAGTENQFTAAMVSFFSLLLILFIDPISRILPADTRSGIISAAALILAAGIFLYFNTRNLYIVIGEVLLGVVIIVVLFFVAKDMFSGFLTRFFSWFSLNQRYELFSLGVLKVDSLLYYASFSGLFLFLTVRLIEKRRWN